MSVSAAAADAADAADADAADAAPPTLPTPTGAAAADAADAGADAARRRRCRRRRRRRRRAIANSMERLVAPSDRCGCPQLQHRGPGPKASRPRSAGRCYRQPRALTGLSGIG